MTTERVWRNNKFWTLTHGDGEISHRVEWSGRCLRWHTKLGGDLLTPLGTRSIVTEFSDRSRLALLCEFARVNWAKAGKVAFITLTYPTGVQCLDSSLTNTHRGVFWRSLERHVGRPIPAIWRIERLPRKTGYREFAAYPHFHVLAFQIPFIHYLHVNQWWQQAIGWKHYCHTHIVSAQNPRVAGSYISKYVAKVESSLIISANLNTKRNGRHWGILRRSHMPYHPKRELTLCDDDTAAEGRRLASLRASALNEWGNPSFTLLGDRAEAVGAFLMATGLAKETANP